MEWLLLLLVAGVIANLLWAYAHKRQPSATPGTNDVTLSSEAVFWGLIQKADTLKEAYARVLEQKDRGIIRAESDLPASKEQLKAALLLCAFFQYHKANGQLDTALFDHFQVGFGYLAFFVADEGRAKRSRKLMEIADQHERQDFDPRVLMEKIKEMEEIPIAPTFDRPSLFECPSPIEMDKLHEEFAQRFEALTDPARSQAEGLRIRNALLST